METAIAHDILSHKPSAKINVEAGVTEAEQDFISRKMVESRLLEDEEQQRQLKMKADQALFELSRVRDECALERQNGGKQISELTERNGRLERVKVELEKVNAELMKVNAELATAVSEREAEREKEKIKDLVSFGAGILK